MNLKLLLYLFALLLFCTPVRSQEILSSTLKVRELKKKQEEIVLLQNQSELIPLQNLAHKKIVHLSLAPKGKDYFHISLAMYTSIYNMRLNFEDLYKRLDRVQEISSEADVIILSVHNSISYVGLSKKAKLGLRDFWEEILQQKESIVVFFGSEAELQQFPTFKKSDVLLFSPSEHPVNQEYCAQIIFGAISAEGRLKKEIGNMFHKGNGLRTNGYQRLSYGVAENFAWDSERLRKRIDSVIQSGLAAQAFPGCQVLVAKNNQVVFHKAYGHHTYKKVQDVRLSDVYDLASITKIAAAVPAIMHLLDEEKIQLDKPLSSYWPDWGRSNKKDLSIKEILAHQAGLIPYIVFWKGGVKKNGKLKRGIFRQEMDDKFSEKVYGDLYMSQKYRQKMYKQVRKSDLGTRGDYVYSGLSFLVFPQIVKSLSGQNFDVLLRKEFYDQLGASRLRFNPWKELPLGEIIPTEYDSAFRKSMVHGYVHDEAAAMMGGVSGNAGLFSNANDLAKLMQMYLNKGVYGGERYISSETMKTFSAYAYKNTDNRRGLGFDKPPKDGESYMARDASSLSFGHSGFTGTFTWVDPKYNLMLVFLSNRVHPTRGNRKLYQLKIRERLHQILYDEINFLSN